MADKYGLQLMVVPLDNEGLKATPVPDDISQIIFGLPSAPNCRAEVYSISLTGVTAVADGTDAATLNLVFHDASADTDTTLLTGATGALGDLEATAAIFVVNEFVTIWHGVQSLDPGDTIRADVTITTPETAGEGYAFLIVYRVKEWGGQ